MLVEDGRTGYLHELPWMPPGMPQLPQLPQLQMLQQRAPHWRGYPVGWVSPVLPYTGMQPRRLYLRCSVWPHRAGLVPQFANQMQPGMPGMQPGMPGMPGMPGATAMPGGGGRRRRRGRHRR
jgi:hypothetical protein